MGHTSDMRSQTRLHKRGANYYLRLKVPADLRRHYGKREIKLSLRTIDPQEAATLVRKHSVALDAEFEALRRASQGIAMAAERGAHRDFRPKFLARGCEQDGHRVVDVHPIAEYLFGRGMR